MSGDSTWPKCIFFGDSITQRGYDVEGCYLGALASRFQRVYYSLVPSFVENSLSKCRISTKYSCLLHFLGCKRCQFWIAKGRSSGIQI
ncbi:unnamed protein product [Hymenolepis diminuta]|uniref:Uncharacterized protein n=1 Tax=Hymenolepis diminuta TaxID=6216 RepID=A0A564Z995_HYMDI|nr:unnamed protein product [Hymenolepis diminuta]